MSKAFANRKPENYDGTETTSCEICDLLPGLLKQISAMHSQRPDLILASWPQVIGEKLAPMTKAVCFNEGILLVKVNNSTLYSLLSQHEKGRLLRSLRDRFPAAGIKNIHFRMG